MQQPPNLPCHFLRGGLCVLFHDIMFIHNLITSLPIINMNIHMIIIMIMITRARPRAQYWSTVTTVGPAQRLSSPLFSWQRFSTNQNHFEILFFLDNYLSMKSFAVPNISGSGACHGSICSSICPTQSWIHGTAQVFDHHHHHFDHYCHHHYSQSWLHGTAQVLFTIIITVDITIFLIVTIIIDPTMDSWHTSGRLAPLSPFLS